MGFVENAARAHFETAAQWRAWLEENHATSQGIFVVSWRKPTGKPAMTYNEMVEQALCFGWVDSRASRLDDQRTMLWFTPRRTGSGWSRPNKDRIGILQAAGLMHPSGQAVVDSSHEDGSWNLLDEIDNIEVPIDLQQAFVDRPGSGTNFAAFSASARKALLTWIATAKTPGTRARRVAETAEKAARGEKANQWTRKPFA